MDNPREYQPITTHHPVVCESGLTWRELASQPKDLLVEMTDEQIEQIRERMAENAPCRYDRDHGGHWVRDQQGTNRWCDGIRPQEGQ